MRKSQLFYLLLALAASFIMLFPVGIANVVFGYFMGDNPCILCWGQRIAMIFIAGMALFIVRYGFKLKYIASIILMAGVGMWQSFRHFGAHAQNDIGQGFSLAIFGIHTQFWAEVIFWCVIMFIAFLFFMAPKIEEFTEEMNGRKYRILSGLPKAAFVVFLVISASNIFQAFISAGPIIYQAVGDPARFSLNPKYIDWTTKEWKVFFNNGPDVISFLGRMNVEEPDTATKPAKGFAFSNISADSPVKINKVYSVESQKALDLKLNAPISDMLYRDGKYLLTTDDYGMYIVNDNLSAIERYLVLDPLFSATITNLIGVNYVTDKDIRITGNNKTFLTVQSDDNPNIVNSHQNLYEGYETFSINGLGRGRLKTSRSKLYYVGTARSYDGYTYMTTVPSNLYKSLIVIEQLDSDTGLAAEFIPALSVDVTMKEGRSLGDLYITAMDIKDGKLYAASKNYNTIVVIDPISKKIVDTYSFPEEITNVRAMSFTGGKLNLISYQDGKNMLFTLNSMN